MSPGFAPPTAALPTRVASRPQRDLPRENCHENETALDHYQVRKHAAWQRHVTLALAACAWLAVAAAGPPGIPPPPAPRAAGISLSRQDSSPGLRFRCDAERPG